MNMKKPKKPHDARKGPLPTRPQRVYYGQTDRVRAAVLQAVQEGWARLEPVVVNGVTLTGVESVSCPQEMYPRLLDLMEAAGTVPAVAPQGNRSAMPPRK